MKEHQASKYFRRRRKVYKALTTTQQQRRAKLDTVEQSRPLGLGMRVRGSDKRYISLEAERLGVSVSELAWRYLVRGIIADRLHVRYAEHRYSVERYELQSGHILPDNMDPAAYSAAARGFPEANALMRRLEEPVKIIETISDELTVSAEEQTIVLHDRLW